jgi:serine/threonine-protein kinase
MRPDGARGRRFAVLNANSTVSRLGRYQLSRVLGQGAMGVVYEGLDPLLNRPVAVKTILRSALGDPETLSDTSTRFVREAQAIARLNHPHIVNVFDFGEEGDIAYFVMEFVRGRELKGFLDDGEIFARDEAVRIVCELLAALDFAHRQGVVHRDVKPANVMLDAERRVKLTDFGVARMTDGGSDRTQAGTMVGTPSYMSPEQIQGFKVGSRTDIFAVGIILYQFLTGTKPFPGPGVWAVQKQIVHDDPVPPSVACPEIDPRFDAVVARALAKEPDARYGSAAEFAEDLLAVHRAVGEGDGASVARPATSKEFTLPPAVRPTPEEVTELPLASPPQVSRAAAEPEVTLVPSPARDAAAESAPVSTS